MLLQNVAHTPQDLPRPGQILLRHHQIQIPAGAHTGVAVELHGQQRPLHGDQPDPGIGKNSVNGIQRLDPRHARCRKFSLHGAVLRQFSGHLCAILPDPPDQQGLQAVLGHQCVKICPVQSSGDLLRLPKGKLQHQPQLPGDLPIVQINLAQRSSSLTLARQPTCPMEIYPARTAAASVPAGTISPGVGTPRHSRKIRPSSCLTGT